MAYIFRRNFYIFLSRFISLKINSRCSLLSTRSGFGNANIMLHCKFYYYYYIEFECVFLLCLEWDESFIKKSCNIFLYFAVGLDRLYKIRKKYRCVPNEIKQNSYCTSANIKVFFLVQYSKNIWKNHILTVLITRLKKKYLLLYYKRVIA